MSQSKLKNLTKYWLSWTVLLMSLAVLTVPIQVDAVSPEDLASNSDHTRLTSNPASLAGIREGIIQFTPSLCRPFTSVVNPLTGGFPKEEKEQKLFNNRSVIELGSCFPSKGSFEPNLGNLNFNYDNADTPYPLDTLLYAGENILVINGGERFTEDLNNNGTIDYSLFMITDELSRNGISLKFKELDSIDESLQFAYSWEAVSLGIGSSSAAEWNKEGSWQTNQSNGSLTYNPDHDPYNTSSNFNDNGTYQDLYPSFFYRYDEWREENITSYGIGVYLEVPWFGPVQLGYRRNSHQYKHEFYREKSEFLIGESTVFSNDYGILLPKFFNYFSVAYNHRKFEENSSMKFKIETNSGNQSFDVLFKPKGYKEVGIGTTLDLGRFDIGFNLEEAASASDPNFLSQLQAYRFATPGYDFYFGEKTSSYALFQIKESTLEASFPFVRIGYKQYEFLTRRDLQGSYSHAGTLGYPTIVFNAYFGSRGWSDSAPSPKKCEPDDINCYGKSNWRVNY